MQLSPLPHVADEQVSGAPASQPQARQTLILLVAQDPRRLWLRTLAQRIDPACRIEAVANAIEASALMTRECPDLVVLDLASDPDPAHGLIPFLARLAPSTKILAFGDAVSQLPNPARYGWSWAAAEAVFGAAIRTVRRNGGGLAAPA